MIRLSNGHTFTFIAASGALAYDGRGWPWEWPLRWIGLVDPSLFTIVTKTLTRNPRRGNLRWYHPFGVIRPLWSVGRQRRIDGAADAAGAAGAAGAVNAVGLTNPGIEWWSRRVAPAAPAAPGLGDRKLIVSLEAEEEKELREMVRIVRACPGLKGIELNVSCPNTMREGERSTARILQLSRIAKEESQLPLILKLGVTHDYLEITRALKGVIDAVDINAVPWAVVFPDKRSPLARFGGGGVSGRVAQPWTWKAAEEIAKAGTVPVIGPSAWDYEDIEKLFNRGVGAVSFGSVFLWYPWRPTLFVRRYNRSCITTASSPSA